MQKNVLLRYAQSLESSTLSELQRNAFHVAAWVAELSAEQATLEYNGLSPLLLLQQYLKHLKSRKQEVQWSDHLRQVLARVWKRTQAQANSGELQWRGVLHDLQFLLPEAKATKAATLMNKAINLWRNTTIEAEQEEYVASLEQSLSTADPDHKCQIRSIFRRTVAALSPPHHISERGGSSTTDVFPQPKGRKGDLQFRLRKIALICLDHLDLTDSRLHPALEVLRSLLDRFQEDVKDHQIGCKQQWRLLQVKCGQATSESNSLVSLKKHSQKRSWCEHNKRRDDCRICSGCLHGRMNGRCRICNPCPHGKIKRNCAECAGCEHGLAKRTCRQCNSCIHGRRKYKCTICKDERSKKSVSIVWWISMHTGAESAWPRGSIGGVEAPCLKHSSDEATLD